MSLGVSPIPKKTCNYSCIYCQLGRTNHMINTRQIFYPVEEIIEELKHSLFTKANFDVVTIVGEGEPTLYLKLGKLIDEIHKRTEKPVAVITNGALLYDKQVQSELRKADIVLPSLDAYDERSFIEINRPHRSLKYDDVCMGLIDFSKEYQGQLWIEVMLMKGINDNQESFKKYAKILEKIKYNKLYLNTPVRPPAEYGINPVSNEKMKIATEMLGGISIDMLASIGFYSEISDDYEAILSIIKRHPMNHYEIEEFLKLRKCTDIVKIFHRLKNDEMVVTIDYKGFFTYRLK